jgi:SAM-dependent methyltransferase
MAGVTDYDSELRRYDDDLRRAWELRPDDDVLDVGCGSGGTTRDAARLAPEGRTLGVDVSAAAIERSGRLARAEGLANVGFEHGDAQVHRFGPDRFDVAISRFGTMFFADPVAAFANIGRALRPDGRLVMLVWQAGERNEWDVAIRNALASIAESSGPDPFSLAEPATVEAILRAAGFGEIAFAEVRRPIYYGPDVASALDWVRGFSCTPDVRGPQGLARLRQALAEHLTDDGVWFDSRAWMVTARRSVADVGGVVQPVLGEGRVAVDGDAGGFAVGER